MEMNKDKMRKVGRKKKWYKSRQRREKGERKRFMHVPGARNR